MDGMVLGSQLTASALVVYFLQWLKKTSLFPWVTTQTETLNRFLAAFLTGAAALGVHVTFDHDAGMLTITGLTLVNIAHSLWSWAQSYVASKLLYDMVKPKVG